MSVTHLQLPSVKKFLLTFIFSMCRLLGNVPLKEHIYGNLVSISIKVMYSDRSEGVVMLDIYPCNSFNAGWNKVGFQVLAMIKWLLRVIKSVMHLLFLFLLLNLLI